MLEKLFKTELSDDSPARMEGFRPADGRFVVRLPESFELQEKSPANVWMFRGVVNGVDALFVIKKVAVATGASSNHLLLTTRDNVLAKLPNFTTLKQTQAKVAGKNVPVLIGRYDYQGNKGHPQVIENAYIIDGNDGFILHVESSEAGYRYVAQALVDVYKTFKPLPVATAK